MAQQSNETATTTRLEFTLSCQSAQLWTGGYEALSLRMRPNRHPSKISWQTLITHERVPSFMFSTMTTLFPACNSFLCLLMSSIAVTRQENPAPASQSTAGHQVSNTTSALSSTKNEDEPIPARDEKTDDAVFIVDWEGPNDLENPRKCVLYNVSLFATSIDGHDTLHL